MINHDVISALDTLALGVIVSAAAYRSMQAAWQLDWISLLRVLEVLVAFIVAIVGAHVMGQHLWAG